MRYITDPFYGVVIDLENIAHSLREHNARVERVKVDTHNPSTEVEVFVVNKGKLYRESVKTRKQRQENYLTIELRIHGGKQSYISLEFDTQEEALDIAGKFGVVI